MATKKTLPFLLLLLLLNFLIAVVCADQEEGLTFRLYENAALYYKGRVKSGTTTETAFSLESTQWLSGELIGSIQFLSTGRWAFDCQFHNTSTGWLWIDGHLVCSDGNAFRPPAETDEYLPITDTSRIFPFRAQITRNDTATTMVNASFSVTFHKENLFAIITDTTTQQQSKRSLRRQQQQQTAGNDFILTPSLPPAETKRDELQRRIQNGWGSWLRVNLLSIVKLPEGLVITIKLCRKSTNECLQQAVPDNNSARVDLHAYDRSYVGFQAYFQEAAMTIEYSYMGNTLLALISPQISSSSDDADDYEIEIEASYAWFRPGHVEATGDSCEQLIADTPGLERTYVTMIQQKDHPRTECSINNSTTLRRFPFGPKLGIAASSDSSYAPTVDVIEKLLNDYKQAELKRIQTKFGPEHAPVAQAIQCAILWTLIYNPVENGPFMPVSRHPWDFEKQSGAANPEWTYVIFDWDNLFASLLAGLDYTRKEIAYSNLFQVVKSKTSEGFIPNFSTGGAKSQDRTEPPVGAKVTLELYRKYKETWPVEVVFDDLLDWNDWFLKNRVLEPYGLIALGSNYKSKSSPPNGPERWNTMQSARFESGLDNSPMYDGNFFDSNVTHLMQLYDVGMSSLFAQEANCLAELADAIGRDPKLGTMLRKRAADMTARIGTYLWDSQKGIFANRFPNGTFSTHISPTSFYPLALGLGTEQQRESMLQAWLFNSSRFCISPGGDSHGNDPGCYWGLPSISADDPTYMKGGFIYWRGYTWGPMAQLVYWSLEGLEDSLAKDARTALCKQMKSLFMSQWTANRHICENYHPCQNASECSGTRFYHWGALNGLIGMMEDGVW